MVMPNASVSAISTPIAATMMLVSAELVESAWAASTSAA